MAEKQPWAIWVELDDMGRIRWYNKEAATNKAVSILYILYVYVLSQPLIYVLSLNQVDKGNATQHHEGTSVNIRLG